MRKLIALILALLLPCAALAEAPAALPIDFTPGHVADPANLTEAGYTDDSITVTMERIWVDKAHFNVARVKIAHPSQLRTGLANAKGTKNNKISTMAKNHNAVLAIGGEELVIGQPTVAGASVKATVLDQARAKKVIVYKYKRKTGYHKKNGHRQAYTELKIDSIVK